MVKIAQVIVDVPLMQTDKPFSYLVPDDMQDQIVLGSRVHVPFGRGNRLLQGSLLALLRICRAKLSNSRLFVEVLI